MRAQELQAGLSRIEDILRGEPAGPEKELALIALQIGGGLLMDIKRIADAADRLQEHLDRGKG